MRIEIEFDTDNAAFHDDGPDSLLRESARLIEIVAQKVRAGHGNGSLRDINGSTVGTWAVTEP